MKHKKLKWKRVNDSFDLQLVNFKDIDVEELRKLLQSVERDNPEYDKNFSKDASKYFRQWFAKPAQSLKEAAYCLLSNWFLTENSASRSTRALYAGNLWDALFCVRPKKRLTDWRISGRKVVSQGFYKWWNKQQKCQEDC